MRTILLTLMAMLASVAVSQTEQSGVPAKVLAANGREFPVFLQGMDGENLTFNLYRSTKLQSVPSRLITKLTFVAPLDVPGVTGLFNNGDYQGMMEKMETELKAPLDDYWPYMFIDNNLQDVFTLVMKAYSQQGNLPKAMQVSEILLQNKDPEVTGPAQSIAIIAALDDGRIEEAEAMLENIKSEPGQVYFRACIHRARGQTKEAFQLVTQLISEYGNDLAWMPQTELLSAYLYMDVSLTNSAINTARQVKNIYANTSFSTDAGRVQDEWTKTRDEALAASEAKAAAEEAQRAEVRARAAERAQGFGFGSAADEEMVETNAVDEAGSVGVVEGNDSNGAESSSEDSSSNDL